MKSLTATLVVAILSSTGVRAGLAQADRGDIPADRLPPGGWANITWDDPHPGRWQTVDVTTKGIQPGGAESITPALMSIVDSLAGPTVLYFPPGTYKIGTTNIWGKSDLILRGAGPDKTIFETTDGACLDIRGVGGRYTWDQLADEFKPRRITADVAPGESTVPLENTAGLAVGDMVMVAELLDQFSYDAAKWGLGGALMITRVTPHSITVNLPLAMGLREVRNPAKQALVAKLQPARNISIEDLKIDHVSKQKGATIWARRCYNLMLKNLELANASQNHIQVEMSQQVVVRDCYIHGAQDKGGGGNGYGVQVDNLVTRMLVVNNIAKDCRHQYVIQGGGPNYNVCAYNLSVDTVRDYVLTHNVPEARSGDWIFNPPVNKLGVSGTLESDFTMHGNYPYCNLVEGNVGYMFISDRSHFWNGPKNMTFRNQIRGQPRPYNYWQEGVGYWIDGESDSQNCIGNVFLNNCTVSLRPHQGPRAPLDSFIAANVLGGKVAWGAMKEGATLPPSLYLTRKPDFWPGDLAWPPFGPDVPGSATNKIPAQVRWEKMSAGTRSP